MGIPQVESRVIFRGDRGRLYARTKLLEYGGFEQCWSVNTIQAVPAPRGEAIPNPFAKGKLAGRDFSVPGGDGRAAKYVFYLNQQKRVELFINNAMSLAAINLDDLIRDRSAGVVVEDWSTAPVDDAWFEPTNDWKCEDLRFL